MTLRTLDEYGVRKLLRKFCERAGGQPEFAKLHKLDVDHVSAVYHGLATPGVKLTSALGLMRVTRYAKQPKGRVA